jgi:Mg-chelatase subunit ChlD
MCGFSVRLPSRRGTVVVVADRSNSMPPDADIKQKEAIDLIQSEMASGDKLAVVSFGQRAIIERSPQTGKFPGFAAEVGKDASNLAEAIQTAISLVPQDTPGRILVLSDGKWTGSDPVSVSSAAATHGISVDYRLIERPTNNDLSIFRLDTPKTVAPGESFMITAWIQSPFQQEVSYQLSRGSKAIALAKRVVSSGLTRLTFRDKATQPGTIQYRFIVSASPDDPVPENNAARILLGVEGQKPLLCVTNLPNYGLANLIQIGQLGTQASTPASCNWALEDLSNFSAVLIEDIPAEKIGTTAMKNIAAWVRETGSGFMMTGGKSSYGPGGYFKSALEPIMPVSMELRREHRKLALAIVVVLDRSGSMAAPVGGGKTKMDLANLASVQVLDLLSPMDEFGVIAVDSSAHTIVNLAPVEKNAYYRNKILRIDSMGGGIFIYEALSNAAKMLASATPQTRHIILFADAADSEEPGKYKELLEKCSQAGITVSVIGLGKQTDVDAGLLEDIAFRGQGRCFFTENPAELPRLFAQDTFVVARSSFLEEPTSVQVTGSLISLTGRQFNISRKIGGYNLCYLRPNANLAAITVDEYKAPIVAAWQAGIGRALCYTGQANGPFTGDISQWEEVGSFFTSLARWVAGDTSNLGPDMLLIQEVQSGTYQLKLYLNPERKDQYLIDLPKVTTLHGIPGKAPKTKKNTMQFQDADTLTVEIPIAGPETALSTVEIPGLAPVTLPPVCLPYSPEYKPTEGQMGATAMMELAKATAGGERVNLTDIWNDLLRQPQMISIGHWLLLIAIVLLLLEVFERRTGLLSSNRWKLLTDKIRIRPKIPVSEKHLKSEKFRKVPKLEPETPPKVPTSDEKTSAPGLLSALSKAQRSAKARTDRK